MVADKTSTGNRAVIALWASLWGAFSLAIGITLALTVATLALAIPATLIVGVALKSGALAARAYVDVSMKLPLIVKLFAFFYIFQLDAYGCAVIALVLHQVAFSAEILRGGLEAVPAEIEDAALTTGLSRTRCFFSIRLPIALRHVAPALVLQTVEVVKNTSIVSLIGLMEITGAAEAFQSQTFEYVAGFSAAALAYMALIFPLMFAGHYLEVHLNRGEI